MSANGDAEDRPGREVAHRLFAAEFDDASLSYAESDEERAPNYVVSPTGARLNRVFAVGTLTEVTDVNEEMVRGRVVDPTGAFVVYAGQYQPDALAFLERAEPPAFVAVTGKARTFEPDDGDRVYSSIRPETLATVDGDTRDRWVVDAAEHTLDRIATFAAAAQLDVDPDRRADVLRANDVDAGFAEGIELALEHYGTTPAYLTSLREVALEAARVVAGEQSQVESSTTSPSTQGDGSASYADLAADGPSLSVPDDVGSPAETATADDEPSPDGPDAAAGAAVGTATGSDRSAAPVDESPTDESADATRTGERADGPDDAEELGEFDADEPPSDDEDDSTITDEEPADDESEPTVSDDAADEPVESDESSDERVASDESPDERVASDESADEPGPSDEELGDFDADGMYEFDEEEREAIEEEYGTEFTSGTEVGDPGEADIDVPEPEEVEEAVSSEGVAEETSSTDTAADDEADADESSTAASDETPSTGDSDGDVDLQARVVETMEALDEGEGAERDAVVDAVTDETGAERDAVEQAIQDALMGGECFEPSEDRLQAI
ncbi:hypothetical protein [Halovivax limisalsi]|uniref:hypothetical protein n=1 Tax=Halovivax limisalsi TaxID=1453760 RepID=UPI001FFC8AAB|nr:hypothetical protein [Halovivax limisalsi]